ncbi:hypothetical protein NCS52_00889500 [Fusarium sp. LHS14.1]|nr:hypothetical protein NCS52_00889500 [Fusarium sp. LHS14.1]
MAEVAGLAIGVFGLAGLIGAFKDTIDLFGIVMDMRQAGQQYEILEIRLDIEKTLLLHWADRVKLLRSDYDRQLNDPITQRLVFRILASIRSILTDTNKLEERYGLRSKDNAPQAPVPTGPQQDWSDLPQELLDATLSTEPVTTDQRSSSSELRWRFSQERMKNFTKLLGKIPLPGDQDRATSVTGKARWADFTSKLDQVVPSLNDDDPESARSMVRRDLALIQKDVRKLLLLHEASVGHHEAIAQSTQRALDTMRQERVLNALWFRMINDRSESITQNHRDTLQWALKTPNDAGSWDDLPAWLLNGLGIYWVSGKAGSGKSTLMKYLFTHRRTKMILSQWANRGPFLMCHYFFSNLGSDLQKSQEGLSRTLLHQILDRNRSLTQEAFPDMWKETVAHEATLRNEDLANHHISSPSAAETRRAFEVIAANTGTIGRLCFFIDGLDELVGEYGDILDFIRNLAKNEHVKIVVSSRPIPACVAAFHNLPRLRLQDLTRNDIQAYVEDKVGSHPAMKRHMRRFPEASASLMHELVEKSSGVWLWIILACRSICSGFDDHDRLSEIRRRVDELPPELKDMFMHMLSKVHKRHQEQGAQLLRICYMYQKTKSPFLKKGLYALGLSLVEDYHAVPFKIQLLTNEDVVEICEELEGRLRSRCWGLLEFATEKHSHVASGAEIAEAKVVFMHRTVFEFLSEDESWKLDCLRIRNGLFDAATALSLYGIHMSVQKLHTSGGVQAMDLFEEGLWWGAEADRQRPDDTNTCFFHLSPLFDNLRDKNLHCATLQRLSQAVSNKTTHHSSSIERRPPIALLLAIEAGATNFVQTHPDLPVMLGKGSHDSRGCQPFLYHALSKQFLSGKFNDEPLQGRFHSANMIQLLLSKGCNAAESVWTSMGKTSLSSLWLDGLWRFTAYPLSVTEKAVVSNISEQFRKAGGDSPPKDF